ncbi:DUF4403 family protein [uncultured Paraglaciecola sp.]|uniref:DUF4403 family protein n=1 Tax=uncultured Paraglaciecola sp. TaxID=1765024 RepID=UPI0026105E56|nr:DUF4403 family protein [uncultured Paraglaciecola sp.]
MRWIIVLGLMFTWIQQSNAQSITDKLLITLVDKHLPKVLHQEQSTPWQMGTYDLTVYKMGSATFSSTHKYLSLTVPIKVLMRGKVNRKILGQKILLNCVSEVLTQARLDIEPIVQPPKSKAHVEISVPVPKSNMYCDGFNIPITPLLEQLVINKKPEWEQQLERDIAGLFKQVGI